MKFTGELISLGVAFLWTLASIACEVAGKQFGAVILNVWRMLLTFFALILFLWWAMDNPFPIYASTNTIIWSMLSGVVGYFFGDWCLLKGYLIIGARYGQLIMTLAPLFAAFFAFTFLHQTLTWQNLLAMLVTLSGIAIALLGKGESNKISLQLPLKGVLFMLGSALGQGLGLVLSKKGLDLYINDMPQHLLPSVSMYMPFSANLIRCFAGLLCFGSWLIIRKEMGAFTHSVKDSKGMSMTVVAVICGPLIGVGFSLMAVQYTAAGIASTIMSLTPILILIPAKFVFKQTIGIKSIIGAIVSFLGLLLFFL